MKTEEYIRFRKFFIIGIICSAITMIGGEIPIGWTVYPEAENGIMALIMGSGSLSMLQLACGVFFGGIGIPLQYYGYKAIAEIVGMGECKKCSKLIHIGVVYCCNQRENNIS